MVREAERRKMTLSKEEKFFEPTIMSINFNLQA